MRSSKQDDPSAGTPSGSRRSKVGEDDSILGSSLRSELLSDQTRSSQLSSRLGWLFNPRSGLVLISLLVIIGCVWLFYVGPGRPNLEKVLYSLAQQQPEPTPTSSPSPSARPVTSTPTPSLTPTKRPTRTPTPTLEATQEIEALPPTDSPSTTATEQGAISGCIPAESITLANLDEELCVTGKVVRTEKRTNSFLIIMVDEPASFYFVSYDRTWENLKSGTCVMATGLIRQLLSSPVMVVGYSNGLEDCP